MTRAAHLEAQFERAADPVLIHGIYNYCHRRCDRCAFTGRCFLYRENHEEARRHGECGEEVQANLRQALDLIRASSERDGIDLEQLFGDADSEGFAVEQERLNNAVAAVERDSLYIRAKSCAAAAHAVIDPLRELSLFHEWPADVAEAIDTIGWHAGEIPAKIYRALTGHAELAGATEDPVQNDWNGSAKVARLAVRESSAAWEVLFAVGETPLDAPIRQTRERLEQIDRELAARFPLAMEFVRPGFDEPEVAAGALTSATPSGQRRARLRRKLIEWFARRFQR
jgi:hypothetical protein